MIANTVADFIALYTAPEATAESELVNEVTLTSVDALPSVEISTNFHARVILRASGAPVVRKPTPGVIFHRPRGDVAVAVGWIDWFPGRGRPGP